MKSLENYIQNIPDFPQKGVVFKDISPLLRDHFPQVIEQLISLRSWDDIDYIVGIESRGFILGSALAAQLRKGFIPLRKKNKLPPPVIGIDYALEYGHDRLEIKPYQGSLQTRPSVVIIDDVLATGGTLRAAIDLCMKAGLEVNDSLVLINLSFLHQIPETKFKALFHY